MTYIVVNKANAFDPSFQAEYATFAEAEAVATAFLGANPKVEITVAKVEKKYTAEVVITAADPVPPSPAE